MAREIWRGNFSAVKGEKNFINGWWETADLPYGVERRCCTAGIKCVCPPHAALSVAVNRATSPGVRGFKKKSKVCAETELF